MPRTRRLTRLALAGPMATVLLAGASPVLAHADTGPGPAHAATGQTYGGYARIFAKSAGQYYSGGQVAGQWTWSPQSASTSDISWGDPASWPPPSAEHFIRRGNWVELAGYSGGQGQPVTEVQRVTSDKIGNASCHHMRALPGDGHREYYVKWSIPATGYCLDAVGTITSTANGTVVHFEHKQQWGPPRRCSNAYYTGRMCITQHEKWWDDNGHAYGLQLDRTQYIARGLGMAFKIRQTYPSPWAADGHSYWTW
ncbi:MAG TPA: hypothetical protein VGM53_27895 [Streptosporangiaceae bacterium]